MTTTSVTVPHKVLADTFDRLRTCGAGGRECVVYWCADIGDTGIVSRVVHPDHIASPFGYEVDSRWVTEFFLDLRQRRETVRVQVHTHPCAASHSKVDDTFALAPSTGFLSLVIPDFAMGQLGLDGAHLVVMLADGTWQAVEPEEILVDVC